MSHVANNEGHNGGPPGFDKIEQMIETAVDAHRTLVANGASFRDAFNELTNAPEWTWEHCMTLARRVGMRIG